MRKDFGKPVAGSIRPGTPWHHKVSLNGFEEIAWDRFLVSALRVREMCVPNLTWTDQVLPNSPGPRYLTKLPDPVRRFVSEEGYLREVSVPVQETQAPQTVQQKMQDTEAMPPPWAPKHKQMPWWPPRSPGKKGAGGAEPKCRRNQRRRGRGASV